MNQPLEPGILMAWKRNKDMRQEFRLRIGEHYYESSIIHGLVWKIFNLIFVVYLLDHHIIRSPIIMETNMANWGIIKKILIGTIFIIIIRLWAFNMKTAFHLILSSLIKFCCWLLLLCCAKKEFKVPCLLIKSWSLKCNCWHKCYQALLNQSNIKHRHNLPTIICYFSVITVISDMDGLTLAKTFISSLNLQVTKCQIQTLIRTWNFSEMISLRPTSKSFLDHINLSSASGVSSESSCSMIGSHITVIAALLSVLHYNNLLWMVLLCPNALHCKC